MDGLGTIHFLAGAQGSSLFSKIFSPDLGVTQSPIQWIPG